MSIQRFLDAQEPVIDQVVSELAVGRKLTHWMWFIFPQYLYTGVKDSVMVDASFIPSEKSVYYALADEAEVEDYWDNDTLRYRWTFCLDLLLIHRKRGKPLVDIFGKVDAMKIISSAAIFLPLSDYSDGDKLYFSE